MKNFKRYLAGLTVVALIFTSCSKEENGVIVDSSQETATLSFGPVLEDLSQNRAASKQSLDELPACTDEEPSYVMIILSRDGSNVVGNQDAPFRIDLAANQNFTVEAPELELAPGNYSLDYFAVYNEEGELIWLAPNGGNFESYFDNPMPMTIDLRAGVKKYVEVSVICFDNRFVNEYGYLFFELDTNEAIEFCIFGNYCDDTGRHYPAAFSVNVWNYSNGVQGALLHSNIANSVELNDAGDYAGTSVCVALPDTGGLDEYYFEITLLNSDAYGNVVEEVIRSGVINDTDVRDLFDGDNNMEYYHFREGNCSTDDSPNLFTEGGGNGGECNPNDPNADCDNDGVINSVDECPNTEAGIEVNSRGCESIQVPGRDIVVFNDINIFIDPAMEDPDNVRMVQNLVNFTTTGERNDGNVVWFDRGRNNPCYADNQCSDQLLAAMKSVITGTGMEVVDVFTSSGSLTEIPEEVKVIFLFLPMVQYTVAEINTLKNFAAEGGRIIFVGEWDGYYRSGIALQNQFLLNMGAVLHNTGGAVDCGGVILPQSSNREHPIMVGVNDLRVGCASVIEPGPEDYALFYDSSNTRVLAGVAKINTVPISQLRVAESNKRVQENSGEGNLDNSSSSGY